MTNTSEIEKTGSFYAIGAYTFWGLFPIYWKLLAKFSSFEILAHRVLWSMVFYWIILVYLKGSPFSWLKLFQNAKTRWPIVIASLLVTGNWFLYIWAVNHGFILESSLGYFITPLLNVLMGWLVLKEQLSKTFWTAVALAAVGVLILSLQADRIPWIALALALTFSIFGLIRKKMTENVFAVSTAETAFLALPALAVILIFRTGHLNPSPEALPTDWILLLASGFVTGLPLLWFTQAATRLPLSKLGFFQYIAPTLQFFLGAFVYDEPLTQAKLFAFLFIWTALGIFSWETVRKRKALSN